MEGQPYETPIEASEYYSEHRRIGLLKLGIYAMFETEMNRVDHGEQTREEAIEKITKFHAEVRAAQQETPWA